MYNVIINNKEYKVMTGRELKKINSNFDVDDEIEYIILEYNKGIPNRFYGAVDTERKVFGEFYNINSRVKNSVIVCSTVYNSLIEDSIMIYEKFSLNIENQKIYNFEERLYNNV